MSTDLSSSFSQGRNIKELRDKTGAKIFLKPSPVSTKYQLCIIDGLPKSIEQTIDIIKRRFPDVDTNRQSLTADSQGQNVKMPSMSQLQLPDEAVNNIILTSVVSAGHVFLQQPGQPSFNALNRLNNCMNNCYCQVDRVPPLPQPIEVGIVCAAPVMDSWYRAQLINFYPEENEADLRFMDYGGYAARTPAAYARSDQTFCLCRFRQSNVTWLTLYRYKASEADFSEDARLFIEQIAQNFTLLQTKTLAYSMDGIPLIEIFYEEAENGNVHSVNRELVERGLAAWYEGVDEAGGNIPRRLTWFLPRSSSSTPSVARGTHPN
ncbi:putative A-kinase anchor protein 1, mitochondrial [Apostichopus japonicus]|uniref:Putative A-kinase anchor protein 1, mitochondrial n=1 Tax=Stichopus japonicus TaxID=307972 RepID=A0A2G8JCE0_STIJA|nr:putative A-kinase anchor protein 1, mitochondrial [Apostichopus japonicus]